MTFKVRRNREKELIVCVLKNEQFISAYSKTTLRVHMGLPESEPLMINDTQWAIKDRSH